MLNNQLKLAFRNLKKNKSFSLINIFGLSLGMACCFLIILYTWHEFNYDTFHENGDQIYRIEYNMERGETIKLARIPSPVAPALADFFPEIEASSRFYPRNLSVELLLSKKQFEVEDVFFVDSSAVDVFEFDFIHGNPQYALHSPDAVVITDKTALHLFGKTDVIGEDLRLAGKDGFRVSGVVKAWPDNSHLAFNMLLPFKSMYAVEPAHARENIEWFVNNNWSATHSYTYVKLKPNQNPDKVNDRFYAFIQEKGREEMRDKQSFSLIPIQDIHLYTETNGPKPNGNLGYLKLFLFIGILTLFIACINFINLSTASSLARSKEVIMRKILGAPRSTLVSQFLGESMLLSFFSFLLSFVITLLALPHLNNLTGIKIPYTSFFNPFILGTFFVIFLLTGFLAGAYPAFFVSRFKPGAVLKGVGSSQQKPWNIMLRKGLITLQFLAAIGFIAGSITLYLQVDHLRSQPLGFNEELVISIPIDSGNNLHSLLRPGDAAMRQRMNTLDEKLLSNPNIKAVTQCSKLPGEGTVSQHVSTNDMPPGEQIVTNVLSVDYDFVEALELNVVAGRDFDAAFGSDHLDGFVINEKAVKILGWQDPKNAIGQEMSMGGKEGKVLGVLKDFHFQSLHDEIKSLVMEVRPGNFGFFALRLENSNIQETLGFLEEQWKAAFPEKGFEYIFLDDTLNETYKAEKRLTTMISYAAFLAIFISCFGLFGLAALLTQQRFKEIGIRKVLGASVYQILQLIAKDFMKLIFLAMLLATPLTWYFLKDWLADFAYAIDFPWWATFVSGLAVMVLAFITISAQSIRAALSNPVDSIREE